MWGLTHLSYRDSLTLSSREGGDGVITVSAE